MKYRLWVWSKSKGQFTHRELPLAFIPYRNQGTGHEGFLYIDKSGRFATNIDTVSYSQE